MVRIVDVAREANVSPATVSLVLNAKGNIAPDTRRRVHETIYRLNYTRRARRRRKTSPPSHSILILPLGVTSSGTLSAYHPHLMHLLNHLVRAGFDVIYRTCRNENDIKTMQEEGFGTAIFSAPTATPAWLSLLTTSGMRILQFGYASHTDNIPGVLVDNYRGAFVATRYLLDRGHKSVGIVRIDKDAQNHKHNSLEKFSGFLAALRERGIEHDPRMEANGQFHGPDRAYSATAALLAQPEPPTAIFVDNDWGSENVLQAVRASGKQVDIIQFGDMGMQNALPTMSILWLEMAEVMKRLLQSLADEALLEDPLTRIVPHLEDKSTPV